MPQISPRLLSLNDHGSDGWELFYRARAMARAGQPVIELTIGEHDIGTDRDILDAMHASALAGHTGYASVPGIAPLRQAIAQRVRRRTGVPTSAQNVVVTAGGQAALFAAHMAAVAPGRAALHLDPCYATYRGTLRAAGAEAVAVPTRAEDAFRPDPAALDAAAGRHRAASLLINSPNNPTGTVYDAATLDGLAAICARHDLWIISDEVYDGQVWEGRHLSPRALPGMAERTLVIGSMSKGFAMTGSRIGWIVAPAPVVAALIDLATVTTYGVPGYIQDAALMALEGDPDREARIAAPFRRRRDLVMRCLAGQTVLRALPAEGAMYVMIDIRATGLDGRGFAEALLDAEAVAVMPGESFGQSASGYIRLALTVEEARLEDALSRLCRFAASRARAA